MKLTTTRKVEFIYQKHLFAFNCEGTLDGCNYVFVLLYELGLCNAQFICNPAEVKCQEGKWDISECKYHHFAKVLIKALKNSFFEFEILKNQARLSNKMIPRDR